MDGNDGREAARVRWREVSKAGGARVDRAIIQTIESAASVTYLPCVCRRPFEKRECHSD